MRTIAIAALAAMLPVAAQAAPKLCGEHDKLLKQLEQENAEVPHALGLTADGGLVEVTVSPDGTWTMILTYPKRPACVVAVGAGWQSIVPVVGKSV